MKLKTLVVVIAASLLLLLGISLVSVWGKESIEDKVCDNQKFTLRQIDLLAVAATGLVETSSSGRSADSIELYVTRFDRMRTEIAMRLNELDDDYC